MSRRDFVGTQDGARWRDLPDWFTSASTCWKRLVEWEEDGILDDLRIAFIDALDEHGTQKCTAVFLDATLLPAKKGGPHRPRQAE